METAASCLGVSEVKTVSKINKNSFDGSLQSKGAFFRKARYDLVQDQINDSVKKYIDFPNRKIFAHMTEERPCQVCGSVRSRPLFEKNFFRHVRCEDCTFVYVNPILKEQLLRDYYQGVAGSWTDMTENHEYTSYQNQYYHFHLDHIEGALPTTSRDILDIGCNHGGFLSIAKERGWKVTGHELNRYAVDHARKKGIEVWDQPFCAEIFGQRRFSAVTLLGVLEHLPYPHQVLTEVRKLLEPGGVLAILVPNIDSIATRILHEKCNTFDGIEHINFWNRNTLSRFLKRTGFELTHAETTISEIYSLNNYLYFEHPYASAEEHPLLLDVLSPDYIHQHYLGHHLCAYARLDLANSRS